MTASGTPRVGIIGTGFGGIGMAATLLRAGYDDVTLFERSGNVGGVWRENTYPGAACDVPAHLYSFSFAPHHGWSGNFPPQPEIEAYLRDVTRRNDLYRRIRFRAGVVSAVFDENANTWTVILASGDRFAFDVLVSAVGQLSEPQTPSLPGLSDFGGAAFHSAHWNHAVDLAGKRVAVIGTGASAIQFVPRIASQVASLTLFQRSAPFVIPKKQYRYPRAVSGLFETVPVLQRVSRAFTYGAYETRALGFTLTPAALRLVVAANRKQLEQQIPDAALRRLLTPTDAVGCKRVLLASDYYPALAQPHVAVTGQPIERLTARGIRTRDGVEHPCDVLIFGTGFAATDFLRGIDVIGRDGYSLHAAWAARGGAEAFAGMSVSGFPNFFLLYGPNTNLGHNSIVYMLETQFAHVLSALRAMGARGVSRIEVRAERQEAFNRWVSHRMKRTAFAAGCRSWYSTADGKLTNNWPTFTFLYRRRARRMRPEDYRFVA